MALSLHVLTRVYGTVFGTPPFQNAAGAAALTNTKTFPVAPNTYLPTNEMTIWPLANGVNVGVNSPYYVYSVLEFPASGLNQPTVKYMTDKSAATLATDAS